MGNLLCQENKFIYVYQGFFGTILCAAGKSKHQNGHACRVQALIELTGSQRFCDMPRS